MRKYTLNIIVLIFFFSLLLSPNSLLHSQTIVSVSPNYVKNGDSLDLIVTGINTNFTNTDNGISFEFYDFFNGFINVRSYTIINDDTIILNVTVPKNSTKGYKDLIIHDTTDMAHPQKYGKHNAIFTDNPSGSCARVTDVFPKKGEADQLFEITVTGVNTDFYSFFGDPPSGYLLFIDDNYNSDAIIIDEMNIISNTSMKLTLLISQNAKQGYYHLMAFDASDINGETFDNFYGKFNAIYISAPSNPEIISVTPEHAVKNQTLDVIIKGKDTQFSKFQFGKRDSLYFTNQFDLAIKDITINSVNVISDTILSLNITVSPYAKNGYINFNIKDSLSDFINYGMINAFCIGPYLFSITPDSTNVNETITIDINCINSNFSSSSNVKVWLSNYDDYFSDIYGTVVLVKPLQQISAKFIIPSGTHQGMCYVFIADTIDGVFYRKQFFQIGEVTSTQHSAFSIQHSAFIKVFPNPFNDDLFVEYYLEKHSPVQIDIFDITGKKVYLLNLGNRDKGYNKENLNAQILKLEKGIYFLRVDVGNKFYMSKIIK